MQELITDIQSLHWWLGVVFVGVVINIFSAYIKMPIDTYLSRYSSRKALALKERKDVEDAKIELLASSSEVRYTHRLNLIDIKLNCLSSLMWSVIFLGFSAVQGEKYAALKAISGIISTAYLLGWLRGYIKYLKEKHILALAEIEKRYS